MSTIEPSPATPPEQPSDPTTSGASGGIAQPEGFSARRQTARWVLPAVTGLAGLVIGIAGTAGVSAVRAGEIKKGENGYDLVFQDVSLSAAKLAEVKKLFENSALLNSVLIKEVFQKETGVRSVFVEIPYRPQMGLELAKMRVSTGK